MYTFDVPECYAGIRALRLDVSLLRLIGFHDTFFAGNNPSGKQFGITSRLAIHTGLNRLSSHTPPCPFVTPSAESPS